MVSMTQQEPVLPAETAASDGREAAAQRVSEEGAPNYLSPSAEPQKQADIQLRVEQAIKQKILMEQMQLRQQARLNPPSQLFAKPLVWMWADSRVMFFVCSMRRCSSTTSCYSCSSSSWRYSSSTPTRPTPPASSSPSPASRRCSSLSSRSSSPQRCKRFCRTERGGEVSNAI